MIGIIPAAGHATRLHGLPKFLLPIPGGYLLERLADRIGVPCFIGASHHTYPFVDAYKRAEDIAYLVNSASMPQTILGARRFAGHQHVLTGMPDTYWDDEQVFPNLARSLDCGAMAAAAVFAVGPEQARGLGMCELREDDDDGLIIARIDDKPVRTALRYAWGALAWTLDFWDFIHEDDAHMGVALQRAIRAGVRIAAYPAAGAYYDCGTPQDYWRCIRELTEEVAV